MPKQCLLCQQVYPDFVDFCVADGARLEHVSRIEGDGDLAFDGEERPPQMPYEHRVRAIPGRARLFPRVRGDVQDLGVEFFGDVVLGRFDPDVGAVDVDLGEMCEQQYIEARHARLTYVEGHWYVEDLDSTNGVFVDRGPRIAERVPLSSGQELALGNALFVFEADEPQDGEDGEGGAE